MIGTRIKGFRHLIRLAKTSSEVHFFYKHNGTFIGRGVALYVNADEQRNPYMMSKGDYLMIFNDSSCNVRYDDSYHTNSEIGKKIIELRGKYSANTYVVPVDKRNFHEDYSIMSQMVAVPNDFESKYSEFCELNKKQMPNATKFTDINSPVLKYIFALTNGSKNFFFWAVNAHYKSNMSIFLLERIMVWNDKYSQLSNKLKKGTITGYTGSHDLFCLDKEMAKLRQIKRASDVINMFNTAQKKALKGYSLNKRDYETLSKFGKLSGKKKNNFIRKMSTVEDPAEILRQMSFLADVHFEWKKESLLDFIKNTDGFKCEIVIDKGDMILLKVNDYETVKRLAKTTNWCISKDKKYWNEYVENHPQATQYVLMDFSRKEDDNLSIVGFTTVHDRGITNAHDFQNKNLMQGKRIPQIAEIKSFASRYIDNSNIYCVLDKYGINLSDVVTYEPSQYKWNRESMFEYLNQCVDEEDYYIIYDDGQKVAIIVESDDVKYFFGDAYIDQQHVELDGFSNEHIIFADFSKKANDPERLVFGTISHNFSDHASTCNRLFNSRFEPINQSFDSKVEEYGLPYDIICRKNNVVERFYNAISSLELATAKDLIKDEKVKKDLMLASNAVLLRDSITNVTFGYNSSDYIDLFYDNGLKLVDVIGTRYASDIAKRIITNMYEMAVLHLHQNAFVPSAEDIEKFNNDKIDDYNIKFYIGNFLMLTKMLSNETDCWFMCRVANSIHSKQYICDLFDLIMTMILDKIDINNDFETAKYIVSYAFVFKSPKVINAVLLRKPIGSNIRKLINSYGKPDVKTTEMWVRGDDGNYTIEGAEINEYVMAQPVRRARRS